MTVLRRRLTVVDRTMIEVRLRDGWGIRPIARAQRWCMNTLEVVFDDVWRVTRDASSCRTLGSV